MRPRVPRRPIGGSLLSHLYGLAFTGTLVFGVISGQWSLFLLTLASPFVVCLAGYAVRPQKDDNA